MSVNCTSLRTWCVKIQKNLARNSNRPYLTGKIFNLASAYYWYCVTTNLNLHCNFYILKSMKLFTPKHQITIFSPASSTIILNYRNMPLSKPYHVVVIIIIIVRRGWTYNIRRQTSHACKQFPCGLFWMKKCNNTSNEKFHFI